MASENHSYFAIWCYVAYAFGTFVVLLRLYTRLFVVTSLGVDDYFIIAATICSTGITACIPFMFSLGIGKHIADLTTYEVNHGRKWAWCTQIIYYLALGLIKTSIVCLYLRIASHPAHIKFLHILGALIFLHGVASTFATLGMCMPMSIVWSSTFPVGCIDLLSFNYFNAAFHILTDMVLALLPIPVLNNLQIEQAQRRGLVVIFGVIILAVAGTIARQVTNAIALNAGAEFSYEWAAAELCTCIEVNMGLICVSVPALQPLFKSTFRSWSSLKRSRDDSGSGVPYFRGTDTWDKSDAHTG
ncbi:uncharacterized protein LTHEOB_13000 [Lasiodiplodia theobromae]|uniref:uncharacterized protein n=1 Tax=Lasiodiplodia theobromae TaxID=45133 RepID=UPI0015C2E3C1|nr:uncharacterized protein LTHEOB_13000 [Lasiodiplodia theobromae]KAF4534194.1 hypothetical protein LTHEOB_13000 [Lasiodiplodia theobromae]